MIGTARDGPFLKLYSQLCPRPNLWQSSPWSRNCLSTKRAEIEPRKSHAYSPPVDYNIFARSFSCSARRSPIGFSDTRTSLPKSWWWILADVAVDQAAVYSRLYLRRETAMTTRSHLNHFNSDFNLDIF